MFLPSGVLLRMDDPPHMGQSCDFTCSLAIPLSVSAVGSYGESLSPADKRPGATIARETSRAVARSWRKCMGGTSGVKSQISDLKIISNLRSQILSQIFTSRTPLIHRRSDILSRYR